MLCSLIQDEQYLILLQTGKLGLSGVTLRVFIITELNAILKLIYNKCVPTLARSAHEVTLFSKFKLPNCSKLT